jgi:hypothetical protein
MGRGLEDGGGFRTASRRESSRALLEESVVLCCHPLIWLCCRRGLGDCAMRGGARALWRERVCAGSVHELKDMASGIARKSGSDSNRWAATFQSRAPSAAAIHILGADTSRPSTLAEISEQSRRLLLPHSLARALADGGARLHAFVDRPCLLMLTLHLHLLPQPAIDAWVWWYGAVSGLLETGLRRRTCTWHCIHKGARGPSDAIIDCLGRRRSTTRSAAPARCEEASSVSFTNVDGVTLWAASLLRGGRISLLN